MWFLKEPMNRSLFFETFDDVKTIPDHLMWDPRLMCLNECFYFVLEVWVGRGHVILFILFLSKTLFFVNDSTSEVFPSFLAEYEVAKAATLWLFSHGVGGVETHGSRGGNISNTEYLEFVRACVHVMSIEQSQWSCELFCRTKGVQHTIKGLHVQRHPVFCEQL